MKAYAALILVSALSIHAAPFGIFERLFSTGIAGSRVGTVETQPADAGGSSSLGQGAVQLIEQLEGFRSNFYTINGDQTIGFGHDCTQRKDCGNIHPPLSQQQGEQLLLSDLGEYEACVSKLPNCNKLNANQFGALTSFTYNSGCGNVAKFFAPIMQSGNPAAVCQALPNTNTLGGELSSRRQKEAALCNQPTTQMASCNGNSSAPSGQPSAGGSNAGSSGGKTAAGGKGGSGSSSATGGAGHQSSKTSGGSNSGKGGKGGGGKGSKSQPASAAAATTAAAATSDDGAAATSAAASDTAAAATTDDGAAATSAAASDPAAASTAAAESAAASDPAAEPTAVASDDPSAATEDPSEASEEPAAASDDPGDDPEPEATPGPVRIRRVEPYVPRWI